MDIPSQFGRSLTYVLSPAGDELTQVKCYGGELIRRHNNILNCIVSMARWARYRLSTEVPGLFTAAIAPPARAELFAQPNGLRFGPLRVDLHDREMDSVGELKTMGYGRSTYALSRR